MAHTDPTPVLSPTGVASPPQRKLLDPTIKPILQVLSDALTHSQREEKGVVTQNVWNAVKSLTNAFRDQQGLEVNQHEDFKQTLPEELLHVLVHPLVCHHPALGLAIASCLSRPPNLVVAETIRRQLAQSASARTNRDRLTIPSTFYPPRPVRILALDGGGMRGLFSLAILRSVTTSLFGGTGPEETRKLCSCFDLLCGTSTGAIIVAGLVSGHSLDEIRDTYISVGKNIFSSGFFYTPARFLRYYRTGDYYSGPLLEDLFRQRFGVQKVSQVALKFFVTATDASRALWSPFLLRSYPNPTSPIEGAADIAFSTALRATSAAPTYFSPVQLPPSTTLVDGGCVANNPAELAVFEAAHLFNQTPTLILSIGTGVPLPGPGSVNMLKLVNEFIDICTSSESTHVRIQEWCSLVDPRPTYVRLSPPELGSIPLDCQDAKLLEKGEQAATTWLAQPEQQRLVEQIRKAVF